MTTTESARLYEDATLTLLQRDNLLVAGWRDAPTLAQMRIVGKHIESWRKAFGDEVAFANVFVGGRVEHFSKDARDEANRLTERFPRSLCSAHVVLLEGLPGALGRTILRAMALVGRNRSPWRVFGDCGTAAAWMAKHLDGHSGRSWSSADVLTTLNLARTVLRA